MSRPRTLPIDEIGEGPVMVDGSSSDAICGPLIGLTFPATVAPQPPFHAACHCASSRPSTRRAAVRLT